MNRPCECGTPGAYNFTDAEGDYSMCQECYDIAQRQQQEMDADENPIEAYSDAEYNGL